MSVTKIYQRSSITIQASSHAFQLATRTEAIDGKPIR
jgi:hypothetical protein